MLTLLFVLLLPGVLFAVATVWVWVSRQPALCVPVVRPHSWTRWGLPEVGSTGGFMATLFPHLNRATHQSRTCSRCAVVHRRPIDRPKRRCVWDRLPQFGTKVEAEPEADASENVRGQQQVLDVLEEMPPYDYRGGRR